MSNVKLFILSHGSLSQAVVETGKLIGLTEENFISLPMDEFIQPEEYEQIIRTNLEKVEPGSLLLVDIFGGTPSNTVARIIKNYDIYAITGFNLPMVLESWSASKYLSGAELQEAVMQAGINGIRNINKFVAGIAQAHQD